MSSINDSEITNDRENELNKTAYTIDEALKLAGAYDNSIKYFNQLIHQI